MPASLSFPGVYIEEVPSGVRTISGVATSITAFIGRAARGPVNDPVTLTSFADFERSFGGLWQFSCLGHAVRAYFQNGGAAAIVVRLHRKGAGKDTGTLTVGTGANMLKLKAQNPGSWGGSLRAAVDQDVNATAAARLGLAVTDLVNLTVRDLASGTSEVFRNVTHVPDHPRNLKRVLASESKLVLVDGDLANLRPAATADPVSSAERALAAATTDAERATASKDLATATAAALAAAPTDGDPLAGDDFVPVGAEADKKGLYALLRTDLFNLLYIPPLKASGGDLSPALVAEAAKLCEARRAILLLDSPEAWDSPAKARAGLDAVGTTSRNAALYFPRLRVPDPLREGQLVTMGAGAAVAGIIARTDATRGVWKAPAGLEATLTGVPALEATLTDLEIGQLNPLGINCLRVAPAAGRVVWGARTREGDDRLASEWKYLPVRRLALFIEETLYRGTQWVVFEPNDEPLWGQIRLNLGAFMQDLFRQGAFQGKTPREAWFVKVDRETTTQSDIDRGIVNIHVGFAPLKPAEFVVLKIQQIAGSLAGA